MFFLFFMILFNTPVLSYTIDYKLPKQFKLEEKNLFTKSSNYVYTKRHKKSVLTVDTLLFKDNVWSISFKTFLKTSNYDFKIDFISINHEYLNKIEPTNYYRTKHIYAGSIYFKHYFTFTLSALQIENLINYFLVNPSYASIHLQSGTSRYIIKGLNEKQIGDLLESIYTYTILKEDEKGVAQYKQVSNDKD